MKKLNITKEAFEKSNYFKNKYGKLKYVSESGKIFKTNKGKILMFKESYNFSDGTDEGKMLDERLREALDNALDKAHDCFAYELEKRGFKGYDGDSEGGFYFNDRKNRKTYYVCLDVTDLQECDDYEGDFAESTKKFGKKFDESMNWLDITSKQSPTDPDKTIFTRPCPMCGKLNSIEVDTREIEDGMSEYGRGARIQDAFPNLTLDEREFFMTGICNDCWENM